MEDSVRALASARTAPAAWERLRERVRAAASFTEAWPLLRDAIAVPRSKVRPEALALLAELCARFGATSLEPVARDAARGPPALRIALAEAVEAVAADAKPEDLLDVVQPLAGDADERVRERAASALGVLALLAPDAAGPRLERLLLDSDLRRQQTAAAALWGLAARDVPAAVDLVERVAALGHDAVTRRAVQQLGFAYRWRPLAEDERQRLWSGLATVARDPKGPGRRAVLEVALPLDAFNAREDALVDLDAFLESLGRSRPERSPANPPPRPLAPCGECGEAMDFQAYFCPACGDVKAHNPLRLLSGLPVERSPPWPKTR